MKNILVVTAFIAIIVFAGCKTKSQSNTSNSGGEPVIHGVVSHQYHATGCSSVIIVEEGEDASVPITLIPKDPIPAKLDKEGTKVTFCYTLLRMPNPQGCTAGLPAEIRNLKAGK